LLAGLILSLTVLTAVVLGIFTAYGAINAILFLFAQQTAQRTRPTTTVLVPSENHAGGD
jgi:hypothetical protein